MSLLETMAVNEKETRASAIRDYAAILYRANAPAPSDASRLRECMEILDRTPEDVKVDGQAVAQFLENERTATEATEIYHDQTRRRRLDDIQQQIDHARKTLQELEYEATGIRSILDKSQKVAGDVQAQNYQLRRNHPLAFGIEPPAPPQPRITRRFVGTYRPN